MLKRNFKIHSIANGEKYLQGWKAGTFFLKNLANIGIRRYSKHRITEHRLGKIRKGKENKNQKIKIKIVCNSAVFCSRGRSFVEAVG